MIDIEELKKRLTDPQRVSIVDFMATMHDAADALSALQSELAAVRQELEEAKRDAEKDREFIGKAFEAHPNLDLDIAAARQQTS